MKYSLECEKNLICTAEVYAHPRNSYNIHPVLHTRVRPVFCWPLRCSPKLETSRSFNTVLDCSPHLKNAFLRCFLVFCLQSSVFSPPMFGSNLEEIMEAQAKRFPSLKLPWILPTLAESVLYHQGASTEGIFR